MNYYMDEQWLNDICSSEVQVCPDGYRRKYGDDDICSAYPDCRACHISGGDFRPMPAQDGDKQ